MEKVDPLRVHWEKRRIASELDVDSKSGEGLRLDGGRFDGIHGEEGFGVEAASSL